MLRYYEMRSLFDSRTWPDIVCAIRVRKCMTRVDLGPRDIISRKTAEDKWGTLIPHLDGQLDGPVGAIGECYVKLDGHEHRPVVADVHVRTVIGSLHD